MKQAPVYDEATAMEIFNQKLALFSQKIELSPDSDISSYEKAPVNFFFKKKKKKIKKLKI